MGDSAGEAANSFGFVMDTGVEGRDVSSGFSYENAPRRHRSVMQANIVSRGRSSHQRVRVRCAVRGARLAALVLVTVLLNGCVSAPKGQVYDPLEKVNRVVYKFNNTVDRIILKPLSNGYVAITPRKGRIIVSNFFDNAQYFETVLNDFLQGKGKQGFSDLGRFLINTTLGMGGLFDPATSIGLTKHQEDFGQTLAVWGVPSGAYLVLPLLGPDDVRKIPDIVVSTVTDALFYVSYVATSAVMIPLSVLGTVDARSRASNAIRFVNESALDPYVFTREAWMQHRTFLIYDGNPPELEDIDFGDGALNDGGTSMLMQNDGQAPFAAKRHIGLLSVKANVKHTGYVAEKAQRYEN